MAKPYKDEAGYAKIKEEFIKKDYKPELVAEYVDAKVQQKIDSENAAEMAASGNSSDPPPAKRAKLTGRNKHRPQQIKQSNSLKMCHAILAGRECKFGDKCTFSHDVSSYMANKPPDIGDTCYVFEKYGKCPYGVSCRFASKHLADDFSDIVNEELQKQFAAQKLVSNTMSNDLRFNLKRKKYDFTASQKAITETIKICQEKRSQRLAGNHGNSDVPAGSVTDEGEIRIRPQEKKRINFSDKIYVAPLTTVGNLPYRRICKEFGADITCGEMAMCSNILQGNTAEWALLRRHHTEDLFGAQLCGGFTDTMTRCAQVLQENTEIDFLDINCGCPLDMVYKRGEGSALVGKANRLEEIVTGISSVLDVPVTVKMRTGIHDGKNIAHTLIPKLRNMGVAMVAVHGRSREMRFTKSADWNYIKQCAEASKPMPIFGNGDILSYEEAALHQEASGVTGVMLARGALIKPWLCTEIKERRHWDISASQRFDMLKTFVNYGLEHWGSDQQGVENTRKFLLEWLSFLYRYIPVGILERVPQRINERPPAYFCRNDLETLLASSHCGDWLKISEMLLGPVPEGFSFLPKHKANAYK